MLLRLFIFFLLTLPLLTGCDADIAGTPFENEPPNTALSVRDASLVDNLGTNERLTSTLSVSWSGDDPDGFVSFFELRFFVTSDPIDDPEEGWTRTTSNDTLVLLPIPPGNKNADVQFEVRAVDNQGLTDPSPARTVFPIQNTPPTLQLTSFDLPPDTTFQVVSFAWRAQDADGLENLASVEISLNDSLNFTPIPIEFDYATLVGDVDPQNSAQTETETRVFLGRGFQSSELTIPNLQLNSENTLYIRAVDLTDTTSTLQRYTWYVKKQQSDILFVNDWRKSNSPILQSFHLNLLRDFLPIDRPVDIWDISEPWVTGSTGNAIRSDLLPPNASPTLQQMLANYRYIYWVATNTTNSIQQNNFPFAAGVMDLFFENDGKIMVHSPVSLPSNPEDNLGNPALLLLPMSALVTFPDSLRPQLRLRPGASVTPTQNQPGFSDILPDLTFTAFDINTLPYVVQGSNTIPLYEASYTYVADNGNQGTWFGSSTTASISADFRIGLFSIPIISEQSSAIILEGQDGDQTAAIRAVNVMLESLGFPKR